MKITVKKKYLILPTSETAVIKSVRLSDEGQLLFDSHARIDYVSPTLSVGLDLSAFLGRTLDIEIIPESDFRAVWSDKLPSPPEYPYRPKAHFTAPYGWLNDPNGLVEYTSCVTGRKTYHLFYQHNPIGTLWANMTWGHATSRDLIHWEHREPALYPDELGLMFSGSAIVDKNNVTGLKNGDEDVILLYYTAAADPTNPRYHSLSYGKYFSQCMAYSTDGGKSFTKYSGNPIIKTITVENRDPKVIWCDELDKYLLALFLDTNRFELFTSDDLLNWTPFYEFHLDGDRECPDIFPLDVEGENRKWIITAANGKYTVGEFKDGKYLELQGVRSLNFGGCSYAAQTFSDVADGRRIQIPWQRNMHRPSAPYNGQMGIPVELSLTKGIGGYTLRAKPIAEFDRILKNKVTYTSMTLPLSHKLKKCAHDLKICCKGEGIVKLAVFGVPVSVDLGAKKVITEASEIPLGNEANHELRFIFDTDSVEVFTNGGAAIASSRAFADFNLLGLSLSAEGGAVVESLVISEIKL